MTKYDAPALDKGLDILEFLSAQSAPQSQLDIANGIERKPNEIYRMLINLEKRGYIIKDPISGKYNLTLRLYHLAHHHSSIDKMAKASELHIINLSETINQSVHIGILYHNKLMMIAQAQSQTPVSLSIEIGSLFPLEKTNSGRIILAHAEKNKRDQILEMCEYYPEWTVSEKESFHADLEKMKKKACNSAKSMLTEGITDFSTPIMNMHNEVIAVLAVSTLTSQMRKSVSPAEIEKEIIATAQKIEQAMGINS